MTQSAVLQLCIEVQGALLANLLELLRMLLANSKGAGIATAAESSERASIMLRLAVH